MSRSLTTAMLALAFLALACSSTEDGTGGDRIGGYVLRQAADGLEIRSIPDQHPTLNRWLARIHPRLSQVGLPSLTLSPMRIVEVDSFGGLREWPRSEVASLVVQDRQKRGIETKIDAADRSWRVLLLRKDGQPLRTGFGFDDASDARALAAQIGRAISVTPEEANQAVP